jgi:hypothetical protein
MGAACSNSTAPATGALAISTDWPPDIIPYVIVSGPHGYSTTLAYGGIITGLPTGTYTITGRTVIVPDPIIGSDTIVAQVLGSPATVRANDTAQASVGFGTLNPPFGTLWIANANTGTPGGSSVVAFSQPYLEASGAPAPLEMFTSPVSPAPTAIAFDPHGNLWVVGNQQVAEFTAAQLNIPSQTPTLVVTMPNAEALVSAAFDSAGDLWTADKTLCRIAAYTSATLANKTGALTLQPDISFDAGCRGPTIEPLALAFDRNGNLWVGDGGRLLYAFPADSLNASFSGLATTNFILRSSAVGAIAFDAAGNLWMNSPGTDSVFALSASQLISASSVPGAGGTPATPFIALTVPSVKDVVALAFDNSGNLWLADNGTNTIDELPTSQLTGGDPTTPTVVLTSTNLSIAQPTALAFGLGATGLPLFAHVAPRPGAQSRQRPRIFVK